jgi:hypothetical protein
MSKPHVHARSSFKKFGGCPQDYEDIHEFLDSSKGTIADNRHRALTHNAWFISFIIPKVFGNTRVNSEGKTYSTRDIAEQHVLEDYGMKFIPSAQDFLAEIEFRPWMQNGRGVPPSFKKIAQKDH